MRHSLFIWISALVLSIFVIQSCDMFSNESGMTEPVSDVGIAAIQTPGSVTSGSGIPLLVKILVINQGELDIAEPINVTLVNRTDSLEIGSHLVEGGLARGDSVIVRRSWDLTNGSAGEYNMIATLLR